MGIEWFSIKMGVIFQDMKEWAYISSRIIFTFEANSDDDVPFMINFSGFGEKSLRREL